IGMDAFARKADAVRAIAGERGADPEINILVQQLVITDDAEAEIARSMAERGIADRAWFASPMVFVGTVDEIVAKLRHVREAVGASYFVVFEPAMEDVARVMARLRDEAA
ncbi:MAG: hypothetical protein WBA46_06295, partial [Thermomicrobiales bacterium]